MDLDAADFDFSDPLDDLPAHALQYLEASAIRATQHPAHSHALAAPESDYGLDDGDEVVNLDDDAAALQYTTPRQPYGYARHVDLEPGADDMEAMDVDEQPRRSQADAAQLLSRIKKLEQEKAREKKATDDLKGKLQTKAGEADTLRRRHEADTRKYERQLADQHQSHGSELARMRAEIERLRREKEQAHTDSMFRQHDAREAGMAQRSRRTLPMPIPSRPRATVTAATSPAGTPRRAQKARGPLGDGFDDDDVLMASPSRARDRSRTATPRQGGKRKRQVADQSPIPLPALQLSEPRSQPTDKEPKPEPASGVAIDVALLKFFRRHDQRYSLLHQLLSRPSSNSQDRILEGLWQHAFPAQPAKKLSSIVYDELANATALDVHELAFHLCTIFLDLWKRCLGEKYYAPLSLVLDAMHFILDCEPADIAVQVAERAVPLIVTTVDLVAGPIISAARLGGKAIASLYSAAQRDVATKIDVLDCLDLLYLLANSCVSTNPEAVLRFWQGIPSGFTLMLLNKEYPQPQIALVLRILSTSALPASLGPIAAEDESQANIEDALISRLTNIFTEIPKTIPDPTSDNIHTVTATEAEVWELRLLVLKVLTHFSVRKHGCDRLAQNRLCIGRLIKHLDYSLNKLYRQPLSPTQPLKIESVNTTMKLIHHIATSTPGFDIKNKLVNTLGGQHAYLVALTRLAFSEGLLLEAGIEDTVVDMAHSILDEGLSIEEGEAFGLVFSSGGSI